MNTSSITRLKTAWEEVDDRVGDRSRELLAVSQKRGVVRRSEISDKPPRADDFSKYKCCRTGDIVLNRFNAYRGGLGRAPLDGMVSPDYLVLRPRTGFDGRYLEYLLRSDYSASEMTKAMGGIGGNDPDSSGFSRIDTHALHRMRVPERSGEEQHKIADYLDRETAKIDALIVEQEGLVEILRERRSAVVSHAVSSAGDVRVPLRRIADVIDCAHVTAEFVDDDTRYPVASIRECAGEFVDLSSCQYTTPAFFAHLRAGGRAPRAGDLLFIRNVSVGRVSAIAQGTPDFAVGQETVLLRRKGDMSPIFLRYVLSASEVGHAIERAMIGSTFRRINVSAIRSLPIVIASTDDQDRTVAYLDEQTCKIDALIAEALGVVAVAKERRSALITAVVVGQMDLRGEVT